MAIETGFYLVSTDIARRAGLLGKRYVSKDGFFILDNKDLSRIKLNADEYVNGLKGVNKIDEATAKNEIALGGYNMSFEKTSLEG